MQHFVPQGGEQAEKKGDGHDAVRPHVVTEMRSVNLRIQMITKEKIGAATSCMSVCTLSRGCHSGWVGSAEPKSVEPS